MTYIEIIQYLESLSIMPKTMPGLDKIRNAVHEKNWFLNLDSKKIITIAGTNGKGTTAATLESLLISAGCKVGLYTSPHLVNTTERIRINGCDITENNFIELFQSNIKLIKKYNLSHFESLTLMAGDYFFNQNLDYVILEVGLGGLYDATNIFPNYYSVITKIGFDHENILGNDLIEIAKNKFGIIKKNSVVFHHELDSSLLNLIKDTKNKTHSNWIQAKKYTTIYDAKCNTWMTDEFSTNLVGPRAIENIATAITVFEYLGYDLKKHYRALNNIKWNGRMQKINWPNIQCPIYLSGDHNLQGIQSLIEILNYLKYEKLHMIVGIGVDKSSDEMLKKVLELKNVKLYLTETPFKGLKIEDYPDFAKEIALQKNKDVKTILNSIKVNQKDIIIATGSLYLVGKILNYIK